MARERQDRDGPAESPSEYRVGDLTRPVPGLEARFSLIARHLALNDVRDHREFAKTLAWLAAADARLVLALNNPYSSLVRGHIEDYFEPGAIGYYAGMAQRGVKAHYYHRTLEEYLDALFAAGWRLIKARRRLAGGERPPPLRHAFPVRPNARV